MNVSAVCFISPVIGYAQVTLLACTAAVRLGDGDFTQSGLSRLNALLVSLEYLDGFILRSGDLSLPPAARPPAFAVLDQQVAAPYFALSLAANLWASCRRMVFCHVDFQLLSIGIRRWFPA